MYFTSRTWLVVHFALFAPLALLLIPVSPPRDLYIFMMTIAAIGIISLAVERVRTYPLARRFRVQLEALAKEQVTAAQASVESSRIGIANTSPYAPLLVRHTLEERSGPDARHASAIFWFRWQSYVLVAVVIAWLLVRLGTEEVCYLRPASSAVMSVVPMFCIFNYVIGRRYEVHGSTLQVPSADRNGARAGEAAFDLSRSHIDIDLGNGNLLVRDGERRCNIHLDCVSRPLQLCASVLRGAEANAQ